jgi:hypothetical protein
VHVKHRVGALRFVVIPGGKIDDEVAAVRKMAALESTMQAKAGMERGFGREKCFIGLRPWF